MLPLTFVGTPLPPTVRLVHVSAPTLLALVTARLLKPPVPEHVSVEHVASCRLAVPPVKVPFTTRLLQVVLPVPSTKKGDVVPLKT